MSWEHAQFIVGEIALLLQSANGHAMLWLQVLEEEKENLRKLEERAQNIALEAAHAAEVEVSLATAGACCLHLKLAHVPS